MPLTATSVKNAKPGPKTVKMFDSGGLYLEVSPKGGKWWRLKYRFAGKEKRLALGVYPTVTLKEARDRREAAKKQLSNGIDPSAARKAEKLTDSVENSFEAVAREWHDKFKPGWTPGHAHTLIRRLERDVFPHLGSRPIGKIEPPEFLQVLRRIEDRGTLETAHRIKHVSGQVFRYAVATGRATRDPTADLKGALPPAKVKHFSSITDPKGIGELLRAIDGYKGGAASRTALQLAPLVFVRPGELRHAEWSEIDFAKAEWRIPAEKMKMRTVHIVPLSRQALKILQELQAITGRSAYVFPSIRTNRRPMSDNTVNAALRRMGYTKEEMTGHGFRSIASTLLHEQGWPSDVIERQLAHQERNSVKAAYNYAEYLPERRKMMQAWADFLDCLKNGADVVNIQSASR
ncbi:MAG: tyrosine-type recombinase/integrase [Candidatus Thiodiazotropha endolucinida]|nr:tyrosine-type recombinase/integrase [Candidatus Thiodiazotropha taylori]MCW4315668.1 tyrosine-type recombinase/integrase [Candidatus Thiodiazotropha taylori]